MKTISDIFTEFLVRNNRNTTDSFITDTTLKNWLRNAHKKAAGHHKWPFTKGRVSTTYTTGSGSNSDEYYFEGYKSDSFRIIVVGGERLQKLNFEDYLIFKEEAPDSNDKVFSNYGNAIFINQKAEISGTMVAYGQYTPFIDATDLDAETVFSNYDEEGNEAIIELMTSYLMKRERLKTEAQEHLEEAEQILDSLWKVIQDEQYAYQTADERDGMFKRVDVVNGAYDDELFKRDQFT